MKKFEQVFMRQNLEATQASLQQLWKEFIEESGDTSGGRKVPAQDFYSFCRKRMAESLTDLQD